MRGNLDLGAIWARARAEFAKRPEVDMEAHARGVVELVERFLAEGEAGEAEVAVAAAILHDVGIPRAIALYGSASPPGQEIEGALLASQILSELGVEPARVEAICWIIARHHQRLEGAAPEFRLVYDADLIVNAREAGRPPSEISDKLYTKAARRAAEKREQD